MVLNEAPLSRMPIPYGFPVMLFPKTTLPSLETSEIPSPAQEDTMFPEIRLFEDEFR